MNEAKILMKDGGLLQFLHETPENLRVLVVESCLYLPELRRMMPDAELYAVVADEDVAGIADYQGLGVHWTILDYHEVPLPFEKDFFDYILAERCLETAANPQDIAGGFGTFLKETGFFLMSFQNIRYWKVVQDLMEGHYYGVVSRWFAKPEMVKLLYASFYKDAVFLPQQSPAPADFVQQLTEFGFENLSHDLETEVWLVQASRNTPEIAALKSCYTKEVRRELVNLLRRMEYDIDVEENAQALSRLCAKEYIFPDYLAAFIMATIIHTEDFFRALYKSSFDKAKLREILEAALEVYTRAEDLEILQKIAEEWENDG